MVILAQILGNGCAIKLGQIRVPDRCFNAAVSGLSAITDPSGSNRLSSGVFVPSRKCITICNGPPVTLASLCVVAAIWPSPA